jgi:hypothetical protein
LAQVVFQRGQREPPARGGIFIPLPWYMTGRSDRSILLWIRGRVDEFVDLLQSKYPADARSQALLGKLADVKLLPRDESAPNNGSWKNGKFKHSTGVLYVAPRTPDGAPRAESSLAKTIVHELAHATRIKEPGEASHSPQWKQTWLWFLSLATNELGWEVDIKCAECTFYGLCDKSQCPKCNFVQNLCRPYVAGLK